MNASQVDPNASALFGRRWRGAALAAVVLALSACEPSPVPSTAPALSEQWREFRGSWNAAGTRRSIALGTGRHAGIVDLQGTLLLSGAGRPGVGFRAEAIGLGDSATGIVGRAVWTDENGDQVYSEFHGTGTATGSLVEGTFIGGTGRYATAQGSYRFNWQYVVETDDGSVQGRADGLTGRVRVAPGPATPQARGAPP